MCFDPPAFSRDIVHCWPNQQDRGRSRLFEWPKLIYWPTDNPFCHPSSFPSFDCRLPPVPAVSVVGKQCWSSFVSRKVFEFSLSLSNPPTPRRSLHPNPQLLAAGRCLRFALTGWSLADSLAELCSSRCYCGVVSLDWPWPGGRCQRWHPSSHLASHCTEPYLLTGRKKDKRKEYVNSSALSLSVPCVPSPPLPSLSLTRKHTTHTSLSLTHTHHTLTVHFLHTPTPPTLTSPPLSPSLSHTHLSVCLSHTHSHLYLSLPLTHTTHTHFPPPPPPTPLSLSLSLSHTHTHPFLPPASSRLHGPDWVTFHRVWDRGRSRLPV